MHFENVKKNDKVCSLIYGRGEVCYVLDKQFRTEGFYTFQVQFENDKVFYTEDGIPDWCNIGGCTQTIFFQDDLDKPELDFQTIKKDLLSKKKITKLKALGKLEMRVPSGAWINVNKCPVKVFLQAIKDEEFYLFRKELS